MSASFKSRKCLQLTPVACEVSPRSGHDFLRIIYIQWPLSFIYTYIYGVTRSLTPLTQQTARAVLFAIAAAQCPLLSAEICELGDQ